MEAVVGRENMTAAYEQVMEEPGISGSRRDDGRRAETVPAEALAANQEELLKGEYQPQPVRRVDIPKPGGRE
jgi:hypothetical protein